ncbi:MAG TPA: DUF1987 domain-containing protein [Taishania sp.]|nr:DUF1987 domain-containing protein [Taishania sp.]
MEQLLLDSTPYTPYVSFDSETGIMEIKGRSIPENADEFWLPILNWFESYIQSPASQTIFKIDLEYFNISSSKRILFLLYKLNNLVKLQDSVSVKVEWYYREDDEDMFEVGNDYAYMVKVPFEFIMYKELELA